MLSFGICLSVATEPRTVLPYQQVEARAEGQADLVAKGTEVLDPELGDVRTVRHPGLEYLVFASKVKATPTDALSLRVRVRASFRSVGHECHMLTPATPFTANSLHAHR